MTPYDQYIFAAAAVIGTYLAMALVLWVTQRSPYAETLHTYRGIAHNFLTVINVIFALNIAFLANDTWSAHDRARDAVFQEAGSLRSIADLAAHLPDPLLAKVDAATKAYIKSTVESEWPLLGRRAACEDTCARLDALITLLSGARVADALPPGVHAQLVRQALEVRAMRDIRISLSQTHVNPFKWLGMAFLGFLTIVSIAMVHIDLPRAQLMSVLLFATAAAPTAGIILVHGNPFQEPMAVDATPIAELLETGTAIP